MVFRLLNTFVALGQRSYILSAKKITQSQLPNLPKVANHLTNPDDLHSAPKPTCLAERINYLFHQEDHAYLGRVRGCQDREVDYWAKTTKALLPRMWPFHTSSNHRITDNKQDKHLGP